MEQPPTPEHVEHIGFIAKFWQEILAGIILTLMTWYLKSKGQAQLDFVVIEERFQQKMEICRHEVKEDIMDEFDEKLERTKQDILREIGLMIKASK